MHSSAKSSGLLISVNVQEEMWAWLWWGGRRKEEYPTMRWMWMSWAVQVVSDMKTHWQLPVFVSHRYSCIRALIDQGLIDWCQWDMHITLFLYYYECFPLYGFSEWKSKLTSLSSTLYWPLLPCDSSWILLFWGQWSCRGRGKILLRTMQRVNSLVLNMRCYRAGDGFFKEKWSSVLTQLYIMVIFGCSKPLGISGGFQLIVLVFEVYLFFFKYNLVS